MFQVDRTFKLLCQCSGVSSLLLRHGPAADRAIGYLFIYYLVFQGNVNVSPLYRLAEATEIL